jgi:hypothetical protein
MSLPRKGSRHIVIGDVRYRWRLTRASIGWREGLWFPVLLAVQSAGGRGQRLDVSFDIVLFALGQGWQPSADGLPPMRIQGMPFLESAEGGRPAGHWSGRGQRRPQPLRCRRAAGRMTHRAGR